MSGNVSEAYIFCDFWCFCFFNHRGLMRENLGKAWATSVTEKEMRTAKLTHNIVSWESVKATKTVINLTIVLIQSSAETSVLKIEEFGQVSPRTLHEPLSRFCLSIAARGIENCLLSRDVIFLRHSLAMLKDLSLQGQRAIYSNYLVQNSSRAGRTQGKQRTRIF